MINGLFDDPDLEWLRKRAIGHFTSNGYREVPKKPLYPGAYVPPLLFVKDSDLLLVDVMKKAASITVLTDFVQEALVREETAQLLIAILATATDTPNETLMRLKRLGIGLLVFSDKDAVALLPAANFSLRVVLPDPQRTDGQLVDLVDKFNGGQPEDALKGLSERIEGLVEKLSLRAVAKGRVSGTKAEVQRMSFADQIELLAPHKSIKRAALIPLPLASDLNSFRGARNLAHHPRMTKKETTQLRRQMRERMMMGLRLDHEVRRVKIK